MKRSASRSALAFFEAFNSRDFDRLSHLLDPDCLFIDSTGDHLVGADELIAVIRKLVAIEPSFRCIIEDSVGHKESVLLRGRVESDVPEEDGRVIWQMRSSGGRISRLQSFRKEGALPMIRLFGPDDGPTLQNDRPALA